ncbi:MAG: copper amine oxidase N-terminal domain-containing protein [Acidobacteriota bacterium]
MSKLLRTILPMLLILVMVAFPASAAKMPIISLNGNILDIAPVIDKGNTLVPMRATFTALGASLDWNEKTRTVTATKGSIGIIITVGSTRAYVDERAVTLETSARVINGRVYVPLRFVSQSLGMDLQWDSKSNIKLKEATVTSQANISPGLTGDALTAYNMLMECKYSGHANGSGNVSFTDVPLLGNSHTYWYTKSTVKATELTTHGSTTMLGPNLTKAPCSKVVAIELVDANKEDLSQFLRSAREVEMKNGVIFVKGAQAPDSVLTLLNKAGADAIEYYRSKCKIDCEIHVKDHKVTEIDNIYIPGKILVTNSGQWINFTLIGDITY